MEQKTKTGGNKALSFLYRMRAGIIWDKKLSFSTRHAVCSKQKETNKNTDNVMS